MPILSLLILFNYLLNVRPQMQKYWRPSLKKKKNSNIWYDLHMQSIISCVWNIWGWFCFLFLLKSVLFFFFLSAKCLSQNYWHPSEWTLCEVFARLQHSFLVFKTILRHKLHESYFAVNYWHPLCFVTVGLTYKEVKKGSVRHLSVTTLLVIHYKALIICSEWSIMTCE